MWRETLGELAEASQATGFGSIYPMRPASYYRELFAGLPGLAWSMAETRHTVAHPSVAALLQSLKGAGVTHTPARRVGSPARYRAFARYYAAHFSEAQGVRAGYAVAYLVGRAPAETP